MFIARVTGNVVTTQKVTKMSGRKMLLVDPLLVDEKKLALTSTGKTYVVVDSLGAGAGELVLVTQGSSARMTDGTSDAPVDCVVIGIIDNINVPKGVVYEKGE
ncbi:MAG TPA: EutN/CcmL family microcompartment protein [Phycisphaerae bacterium]|nr:EutN/CcmL family microcompartment protein [Phycisphaerae bacterium]